MDKRNWEISDTISGIKTIKFNVWEEIVYQRLKKLRLKETKYSGLITLFRGMLETISFASPLLASLISIIIYKSLNNLLTLGDVFYIITVFNSTAYPLRIFFFAFVSVSETKVALNRIELLNKLPD